MVQEMNDLMGRRSLGRWFSTEEAAGYLGVSRWTMQRMVKRGFLRHYRHPFDGRVRIFKGEDLDVMRKYRNGW
jgi:excisionase family DNA binding protein